MGESHLPFWTPGSGHFAKTLGQKQKTITASGTDLVLFYLDSVPISKDKVFTIGDFGANDGYSSMPLMNGVIGHLRQKYGDDLPIQVIYEDQEKNDFNSLFSRLNDSSSYMYQFPNVYPSATNINFYKQCVPDNSCDVIFSCYASHWLEKLDMHFKDCVFENCGTKEELQKFRAEAERDWTKFLALRAKELRPGGFLVSLQTCRPSSGSEAKEDPATDLLMDMEDAWSLLKDNNRITQEEFERCTVQGATRTEAEIKAPFEKPGSAVYQAGLRLEHYDEMVIPCNYKTMWREHSEKNTEKGKTFFADWLSKGVEVWTWTSFYNSLSDTRTEEDKSSIMEELYRGFRSLVKAKDIETYRSGDLISRIVAKKL